MALKLLAWSLGMKMRIRLYLLASSIFFMIVSDENRHWITSWMFSTRVLHPLAYFFLPFRLTGGLYFNLTYGLEPQALALWLFTDDPFSKLSGSWPLVDLLPVEKFVSQTSRNLRVGSKLQGWITSVYERYFKFSIKLWCLCADFINCTTFEV